MTIQTTVTLWGCIVCSQIALSTDRLLSATVWVGLTVLILIAEWIKP
jgi:hypothetical protein